MKKNKLPFSFFFIIFLFFSCGIFTLVGLIRLENHNRTLYNHPFTVSRASLKVALNITKMHRIMKDVVLSNSSDEIPEKKKELEGIEQEVYKNLELIRKYILGNEGRTLVKHAEKLFIDCKPIRKKVFYFLEIGDRQKAINITQEEGAERVEQLEDQAIAMSVYAANKAAKILEAAEKEQNKVKKTTVVLSFLCLLIAIAISFYATSFVFKSEKKLQGKNLKLKKILLEIKTLQGLLSVCSSCNKIKDNNGEWQLIEKYIYEHSSTMPSHGLCPECQKEEFELDGLKKLFNPFGTKEDSMQ